MIRSTTTLAELKTMAEDGLDLDDNSDLNDITAAIAVNDFMRLYIPEEQRTFPSASLLETDGISITSDGYTLSDITDFGRIKSVYKNSIAKGNRLFPISKANPNNGFYVRNGVLFLAGEASGTIIIEYFEKNFKIDISDLPEFADVIVPVLEGMEFGLENIIAARYTRRDQSDPQAAINYRNDALADIASFMNTNKTTAFISLHN